MRQKLRPDVRFFIWGGIVIGLMVLLILLIIFVPQPVYVNAPTMAASISPTRTTHPSISLTTPQVKDVKWDCGNNFMLLWNEKVHLERYLIQSVLSNSELSHMTIEKIQANNQAIGDSVNCLFSTTEGYTLVSYMNQWDNMIVAYIGAVQKNDKASQIRVVTEMTSLEIQMVEIYGSLTNWSNSQGIDLFGTYRQHTIAEIQSIYQNEYATSYIQLDGAKNTANQISTMIAFQH
jgi:hypothetical protein